MTEIKKDPSKKHYAAIDGLRAFSAIGIVLMHVLSNGNYSLEGFVFESLIPSFTNLVFLFMIISGFAMCCGYYDKILEGKVSLEVFYGKRFAKAWPFFALLCVFDLLIAPSINSLYEVFANLTLCFGLLPNANISVIGVGWFLGVVFVFYLIFPFFCYLISNKCRAWVAFGVALAFNLLCSEYFGIGRTNFLYCAVYFLAGGLIFIYRECLEKLVEKYRWAILIICVVVTIGYYIFGASVTLMLVLFSLYLIYALGIFKKSILRNPVTRFVSSVSMEIYLSHMVIYRVLEKLEITHLFANKILSYITISIVTIVGTIVFAVVVRCGLRKFGVVLQLTRKQLKGR